MRRKNHMIWSANWYLEAVTKIYITVGMGAKNEGVESRNKYASEKFALCSLDRLLRFYVVAACDARQAQATATFRGPDST